MIASDACLPAFVHATPLEYLERLLMQNRLFGDDIQLIGVAEEDGRQVILTSQPFIHGSEATLTEIELYFRSMWFQLVTGLNAGRRDSPAFYRDLDETLVLDAHQGNLIKDNTGHIIPIDLILVRADDALQKALQPLLS